MVDFARDEPPCRFCGSRAGAGAVVRTIHGHELVEASCCGCIGVVRETPPDELSRIYDELFSHGEYDQHRAEVRAIRAGRPVGGAYRRRLLNSIARSVPGRRLLEIGVGSGAFGVMARSLGWDYVGYDISSVAVGFARECGLDAREFVASHPPDLPENRVDVAVMWEVLEHVWDVRGYVTALARALRPGGVLLLTTPNYWREGYQRGDHWPLASRPPVHMNFFTDRALAETLLSGGFDRTRVFKRRLFGPSPRNLTGLGRSVRRALGIEESPTLVAIARRSG